MPIDNRHGLIVATDVCAPSYDAEPDAAVAMLGMHTRPAATIDAERRKKL